MPKSDIGRLIFGTKDLAVRRTSEKGVFAIAFTHEDENFAIAIKERLGAKLMIQLVALLGSKNKGKAKAAKMAPDKATAIVPDTAALHPEEDGGAVAIFDMNGIDVPIRLEAEQLAEFAKVIEAQKPVSLDVDEMSARAPNALETDNRFFLQMSSGGNKIEWKFGREKADELHRSLGAWLSDCPPSKPH
jgi:hypothetical protein